MNDVTEWIISGNQNIYKVEETFRELKKVYWKQSINVAARDIVYIYLSKTIAMIKLKC